MHPFLITQILIIIADKFDIAIHDQRRQFNQLRPEPVSNTHLTPSPDFDMDCQALHTLYCIKFDWLTHHSSLPALRWLRFRDKLVFEHPDPIIALPRTGAVDFFP